MGNAFTIIETLTIKLEREGESIFRSENGRFYS